MLAVIQAGGLGSRLKSVTGDLPKPLVPLAGRPAIFRMIDWARKHSIISKVIVLAGYRGELLRDQLDKEFSGFVRTIIEPEPLGSGGCLKFAQDLFIDEQVLLLGGDLLIDVDFDLFLAKHKLCGTDITIIGHGSNHPFDADLIVPSVDYSYVKNFLVRPHPPDLAAHNIVNAAIMMIEPDFWRRVLIPDRCGFEKDVLQPFGAHNRIGLHITGDYIQDLGTPERLSLATRRLELVTKNPDLQREAVLVSSYNWRKWFALGMVDQVDAESLSDLSDGRRLIGLSVESKTDFEDLQRIESVLGKLNVAVSWRPMDVVADREIQRKKMAEDLGIPLSSVKFW